MKKLISLILCVALCFTLGAAVFADPVTTAPDTTNPGTTNPDTTKPADKDFKDVPADYKHYEEIMYVNGEGLMLGFKDGTFRPTAGMTRAQLANVVYRMEKDATTDVSKLPEVKFDDADTIHADYMEAVKFCVANELMLGYKDNTFRPNEVLTRAQFVTVFCRMNDGKATSDDAVKGFTDADAIAKDYVDAVNWAVENKLVQGYEDNSFQPNAPLTRQIFCVILYRHNADPITTPITTPITSPVTSPAGDPITSTVKEPVTEPVA